MELLVSRWPGQDPPGGYDLGDIEVIGGLGRLSSKGHVPDQGMMVFVAVSDLLDGLRGLLRRGGGSFAFVGADSSFSLSFALRKNRVVTTAGRKKIDESETVEFIGAIRGAVENFMSRELSGLPADDPMRGDLVAAFEEFGRLSA
ncbi:hypothetical protein LX15_006390 [Streptoalloteichus tenebrarius]|uniref:Uncharacterized protein n=1 Tax=Streptoalloteichus tenebrarius (strain ATCC 17920 / DSM 40477 / JCM 4838 / CBS 697.72 / NBRC 16177 / NCIMB 11028 / NRRL B-12390 / A12253. 1 / ISP 5477) TaxID=1933 RepID=A0ABT1I4B9_STRSD|nr:hypothetical protein [Streptoalloteichus tenebrarius]MCP2262648.1 hypothetical protein [Streptoalloteichus tenebrarius]BFF03462.1 hypothetical protein GCM10020241_51370 [Streptoalloteichus tenebrarius]